MKINYVNRDHVHALVDLPTSLAIEDMMHLFKGNTSRVRRSITGSEASRKN